MQSKHAIVNSFLYIYIHTHSFITNVSHEICHKMSFFKGLFPASVPLHNFCRVYILRAHNALLGLHFLAFLLSSTCICCLILALPSHRLSNGFQNVLLDCWLSVKYLSWGILLHVRVAVVQEVCCAGYLSSIVMPVTFGKLLKDSFF